MLYEVITCNQCEQTAKGLGCNIVGVCGKKEEVADLQDLLIYALQGLALFAQEGRKLGIVDEATDLFTYEAIFSTLTNVDFDPDRFVALINRAVELREAMKAVITSYSIHYTKLYDKITQIHNNDIEFPNAEFQPSCSDLCLPK